MNPASDKVCNIQNQVTALEAKFSLRFMTAWALSGVNTAAIETYTDEACSDPRLVALRDRIQIKFDDQLGRMESRIEIKTGGKTLEAHHDASIPIADPAEQGDRLTQKFLGLVEPALGPDRAESLQKAVETLSSSESIVAVSKYLAG